MHYKTRYKMYKIIGIIVTLTLLALGTALALGCRAGNSHDDGYSVGTLINVRQEGVLWSRPAATLLHTGEMKGDEFALDPAVPGLYEQAMHFADHSARVKIKYAHRYVCWAWNYASCNIIVGIEPDPAAP